MASVGGMSHDGENVGTRNSVVSSRISTYVLSRQTDVFTIPELVMGIRYMLKLILKRLSVAKNRNAPQLLTKLLQSKLLKNHTILCFREV